VVYSCQSGSIYRKEEVADGQEERKRTFLERSPKTSTRGNLRKSQAPSHWDSGICADAGKRSVALEVQYADQET